MKNKLLYFWLICPLSVFAVPVCTLSHGGQGLGSTFYGTTNCGNGSVDSITVVGDLNLSGTTVNQVNMRGEFDANDANINSLTVIGSVDGQDSSFGTIIATGNVSLDSSSARSIVVNGTPGIGTYAVYLGNHAVVGNITFSQGGGVVYISNDSQIQGTVSGATVENTGNGSSIGGFGSTSNV